MQILRSNDGKRTDYETKEEPELEIAATLAGHDCRASGKKKPYTDYEDVEVRSSSKS